MKTYRMFIHRLGYVGFSGVTGAGIMKSIHDQNATSIIVTALLAVAVIVLLWFDSATDVREFKNEVTWRDRIIDRRDRTIDRLSDQIRELNKK